MLKEIPICDVKLGSYIIKLDQELWSRPFPIGGFLVDDYTTIYHLHNCGLRQVTVDVSKTSRVKPKKWSIGSEKREEPDNKKPKVAPVFADDIGKRVYLAETHYAKAVSEVAKLMRHVGEGKKLKIDMATRAAEVIVRSNEASPHMLNATTRVKTREIYTYQHTVGVTSLLTSFAMQDKSSDEILEIAIGGILHDIGKVPIPDEVLHKTERLTDEEFKLMKQHVRHSREILYEDSKLTKIQADIALQHHMRPDGKGYDSGLSAEKISEIGATAAIIDVYDALSTRRVYKEAWEPTHALKNMLKWGEAQFNIPILTRFIKHMGIYPSGTCVLLESGRIGYVLMQNKDLLKPIVRLKLDTRTRRLMAEDLDLTAVKDDRIERVVSPFEYSLDERII